ncbi:arf-GAP with coiled-coil, ANK repeat and PH domain-containing protein 2-like isoform X2 [Acanthaster planci]|uniref:Arf-GAP with coiled-coil, ANK repeat and PH domain-containing protein 2-like isoform X2 n=1 Tax=Acanthaster planci TaxID=133434 RepID=A0A8B7XZM2_ACAPL|nr:arf-GAP with coiled-coil, ANK repeat and PH domain-containing protein 2-like isoform X2 [Acanthaster planci]
MTDASAMNLKPKISFEEALKDSPNFRSTLEESEHGIAELESKLEKMVKLCNAMVDTGKAYNVAFGAFIQGVKELGGHFTGDNLVQVYLMKFIGALSELQNFRMTLDDQAHRSVSRALGLFMKEDLKKVKETKRLYDRISDDLDTALHKNAQAPKAKPSEVEEVNNVLTATRSAFGHTALDYVFQVKLVQTKERHEVLNTMLSFMHSQNTFFHQGFDLMKELEPSLKELGTQLQILNDRAKADKKDMEGRHTLVQKMESLWNVTFTSTPGPITMEGYLFKKTNNAFKTWHRRWFTVKNDQLVYQKRTKGGISIAAEDLRLCNVKPLDDIDRRFCFEIVLPGKTLQLQADNDSIRQAWIQALQAGINSAYCLSPKHQSKPELAGNQNAPSQETNGSHPANEPKSPSFKAKIQALPGNDKCCDCKSENPTWCSINLGITLCIECSGIHRSLGVHISKVRSLTLDSLEPETLKVMLDLGNDIVRSIYEARVDETVALPASPNCSPAVRRKWIQTKYIDKSFLSKVPGTFRSTSLRPRTTSRLQETFNDSGIGGSRDTIPVEPGKADEGSDSSDGEEQEALKSKEIVEELEISATELLFQGSSSGNVALMMDAIAHGAAVNEMDSKEDSRTPMHKAASSGNLGALEFLLLNRAKVNVSDISGVTPLHIATTLGNTGMVCLCLKRGAVQTAKDKDGRDPLMIAIESANADIVTLLRLARLNEEMKESEGVFGNPDDETFQDVFRDFTNLASNNPEALNRNFQEPDKPTTPDT